MYGLSCGAGHVRRGDVEQSGNDLLEQVETAEEKVVFLDDTSKKAVQDKLSRAQSILESVEADGSWGVHNLKYTESLLLEAKQLLKEVQSQSGV